MKCRSQPYTGAEQDAAQGNGLYHGVRPQVFPKNPPNQPAPFSTAQVAVPWPAMTSLRPKFPLDKHIELFFHVPYCTVAFLSLTRKDNLLV